MQKIRDNLQYRKEIQQCAKMFSEWDILENKTILITGATGMIGVFLIDVIMEQNKQFNANINILAIGRNLEKAKNRLGVYWNNKDFCFIAHDVNQSFDDIKFQDNIDFIIHGASNTHPILYSKNPINTIETNVIGTKNLLELAISQERCRFVFLSSVEIYGENRSDKEAFQEEDCGYLNCNTLRACYSEGKRLGETLCQAYMSMYDLDIVIARLCRVYGPTVLASDTKVLSQFMKQAIIGADIILKSNGRQKYSYLYITDAISGVFTVMLKGKRGEAYNIADEASNITIKELAECLAKMSARKVIHETPDEIEKRGYSLATKAILNADKLKGMGWKCRYNIHQGLRITYDILKH